MTFSKPQRVLVSLLSPTTVSEELTYNQLICSQFIDYQYYILKDVDFFLIDKIYEDYSNSPVKSSSLASKGMFLAFVYSLAKIKRMHPILFLLLLLQGIIFVILKV